MAASQSVCVVDSNILIDFHSGGLLKDVFRLPYQFISPDVIIEELTEPNGRALLAYGLESRELSGAQVEEVMALRFKHSNRVSVNDLFALVLARICGCLLLTGERNLTAVANQEGVRVHGSLWLLDEMVTLNVVLPRQAAQGLKRMLACGRRLPRPECDLRLARWRVVE